MMKALSVVMLLLAFLTIANAQENSFVGDWDVKLTATNSKDQPWKEIKYPVRMSIRRENGKFVGSYTDQYDYSDHFSVFAVRQNEILFVVGGVGKKNIMFFGPVHRAILKNGVLHGFVFTDRKLFEWTATKHHSSAG